METLNIFLSNSGKKSAFKNGNDTKPKIGKIIAIIIPLLGTAYDQDKRSLYLFKSF